VRDPFRKLMWLDVALAVTNVASLAWNAIWYHSVLTATASGLAAGFCAAGAVHRWSIERLWRPNAAFWEQQSKQWQELAQDWRGIAYLQNPEAFDQAMVKYRDQQRGRLQ
jgi:hypothetical protein